VVSQRLIRRADGKGRVPAVEIMRVNPAIANLIRLGDQRQIYSVMQTNTGRGMQTLEQALVDLVTRGVITQDVALSRSSRPDQLLGLLKRSGLDTPEAAAGGLRVAGS